MLSAVSVDASEAGAGNLEVAVRSTKTGARIPHFLEADDRSTGLFQIRFTPPPDCFRYEIDVSFNDLSVNGLSRVLAACPKGSVTILRFGCYSLIRELVFSPTT